LAKWSNIIGGREVGVAASAPSQLGGFCSGTVHRLTTASFDLSNDIISVLYTKLLLGWRINTPSLTIVVSLDSMHIQRPESLKVCSVYLATWIMKECTTSVL